MNICIPEPGKILSLVVMLLVVSMACAPAAAPDYTEPRGGPTARSTVDPTERALSAEMECSPSAPGDELGHDHLPSLPLEKLIDGAAVIVHVRGLNREQARVPDSDSGGGKGRPKCLWVVYADVQVHEYLKGEGPATLRVALPVAEIPRADRPLAMVKEHHDVKVGKEYVLFLQADRLTAPPDQDDRTWSVLFESHGRWPVEGESLLTRLEPPDESMSLDELRTAISPLGPGVLPTVGPMGRAVGAATECSSDLAEFFDSEEEIIVAETSIFHVRLGLEELIDGATAIVHAQGVIREQVNIPARDPSYPDIPRRQPVCEWVVFVDVEVQEYLKGDGPETLRVVLLEASGPQLDRPLVRVEGAQDVKEGFEYVLFLQERKYPDHWGLTGRTWALFGGPQGRWTVAGGISRTRLAPPMDEMTMDELRSAISP